MELNYGDIVETVRDERGTVIGFDEVGYVILRLDEHSTAYINPKHIDLVERSQD
jgi:hypothetical protein